jgi:hypothetical protein
MTLRAFFDPTTLFQISAQNSFSYFSNEAHCFTVTMEWTSLELDLTSFKQLMLGRCLLLVLEVFLIKLAGW